MFGPCKQHPTSDGSLTVNAYLPTFRGRVWVYVSAFVYIFVVVGPYCWAVLLAGSSGGI